MGSSSDGPAEAQDISGSTSSGSNGSASSSAGSSGAIPPQDSTAPAGGRGFFGRLISAFSNADASTDSLAADQGASRALALLAEVRVDDIAIPKAEIVAVPLETGLEELVQVFRSHGFSRLPVYDDSLDHPQGLVLLKDVALRYGFGGDSSFSMKDLLRPILFVPPSMPAAVLLQKMQKERAHMARVIDALQSRSMPFELMLYPGQRHGVRGNERQLQQWRTYLDFFDRTIGERSQRSQ